MIYVQLRARVKLAQGETLHVADAAKVLGSEKPGIAPSSAQPPPASTRWMPSPLPRRSKSFPAGGHFPHRCRGLLRPPHQGARQGFSATRADGGGAADSAARQRFGADVVSRRREHAAGAGGCLRCHHRRAAGRRASHHHPLLHRRCAGRMRVLRDSLPASNDALGGQADRVSGGHGESRGEAD